MRSKARQITSQFCAFHTLKPRSFTLSTPRDYLSYGEVSINPASLRYSWHDRGAARCKALDRWPRRQRLIPLPISPVRILHRLISPGQSCDQGGSRSESNARFRGPSWRNSRGHHGKLRRAVAGCGRLTGCRRPCRRRVSRLPGCWQRMPLRLRCALPPAMVPAQYGPCTLASAVRPMKRSQSHRAVSCVMRGPLA
ncbi:hypothetical protein SPH9361_04938 [Sphingobium sp. CECT 9361]|nr:hypothetical protein SPH9361_04938 [Sphingobium sp. CECT 9361]